MTQENYEHCIEACQHCLEACEACATACLAEEHVHHMTRCIQLDRTCADLCAVAIREIARESEFTLHVCRLCAEVCDACGDECGKHPMDHCQDCAAACRACAEACRDMAGVGAMHGSA